MISTERLEHNRRMAAKKLPPAPPENEMEEELEHTPFVPLNAAASIFDRDNEKRFGGLNSAPSIFDRGAVFRTGKK